MNEKLQGIAGRIEGLKRAVDVAELDDGMKDAFEIIFKAIDAKASDLINLLEKSERMLVKYQAERETAI